MNGKNQTLTTIASAPILTIGKGKGKKRKVAPKANWKNKAQARSLSNGPKAKANSEIPIVSDPKEVTCYYCNENLHCKWSAPK